MKVLLKMIAMGAPTWSLEDRFTLGYGIPAFRVQFWEVYISHITGSEKQFKPLVRP
jgi:hypothetical protein